MREVSYIIQQGGVTVERYLRRQGLSRQLLTALKAAPDGLSVNGAHARTIDRLRAGDRLTLRLHETPAGEGIVPSEHPLDIVYEDEDLLVVNKPAGMAVHPSQGNREGTLANALAWRCRARGEPFVFRAIGRLDKNTSGLVLLAKNKLSACLLTAQSRTGGLARRYLAVCTGELPDRGVIDAPIGRVPGSVLRREVRPDGDRAVTHFTRLRFENGFSLAEIRLETGRTHQIRVHFASIGHPLPGDFLYGPDFSRIGRHALHAYSLRLRQPVTGEPLAFAAPLPADLAAFFPDGGKTGQIPGNQPEI